MDTTDIIVTKGINPNIVCMFNANPAPNVTWQVNGSALVVNESTRFRSLVTASFATLFLHDITSEDTGNYSCRVDNGIGSAVISEAVSVLVRGEW